MLIEAFAAGAGAAGALLLVGGTVALRWQRNAQQYELAKAALDQGLPPPADPVPAWLLSSRTGAMRVAVGVGLILAGGLAWIDGAHVPPPPPGPGMAATIAMLHGHPPGMPPGPADHGQPPGPPDRPGRQGPDHEGPQGPDRPRPGAEGPPGPTGPRPGDGDPFRPPRPPEGMPPPMPGMPPPPPGMPGFPPPPPDPETLRWVHAQGQMHLGQLALAAGLIVALTGFVRVLFARLERRHALATTPAPTLVAPAATPPNP